MRRLRAYPIDKATITGRRRKPLVAVLLVALVAPAQLSGQELLDSHVYQLIRDNSSGEIPFQDFRVIVQYPGYSPSAGTEPVAQYLASTARAMGLSDVTIERYPTDGDSYMWAVRTKPVWDIQKAQLWLEKPHQDLLADYAGYKGVIARFSRTASVTAQLIDVGAGAKESDYAGKSVEGKIVLATGAMVNVMQLAVWKHKAAGLVLWRTQYATDFPDQIQSQQMYPWKGPHGEMITFAFSLSYRAGNALRAQLAAGDTLVVRAEVEGGSQAGTFPEVIATIPGKDPSLPVVLVYAHDNSRNTGGANNLTGVGCTLEVARLLNGLIASGQLERPRRTIRFMWGPEHDGVVGHFFQHPDDIGRILAMLNIDMIGYSQDSRGAAAVFHLYRSPTSNPSFFDDVAQFFVEKVGDENTISIRNADFLSVTPTVGFRNGLFAPTGSRDQFRYSTEAYWGPSDHEEAQTFGVQAVMLNDYPDYYLSTQMDNPSAAGDPTQMRRGVVIAASTAYYLASATDRDLPALLHNAYVKALARMAADEARAFAYVGSATASNLSTQYTEARNVILEGYAREATALETMSRLVGDTPIASGAKSTRAALEETRQRGLALVDEYARSRAAQLGVGESKLAIGPGNTPGAATVPVRNPDIRGPVNFLRSDAGRNWLIDKTGDENFDANLRLVSLNEYEAFEALNFANGKRSLLEIRNALSAEYDPVPLGDVVAFFDFLQKVGVTRTTPPTGAARPAR